MNTKFKNDINEGLSKLSKTLPSKYFYDKIGDALFVKIMNLPEYYLTKAEFDIFKNQTKNIISSLGIKPDTYFELIELGAGDGTKTKELLKVLLSENFKFEYLPIDISINALNNLEANLNNELPDLKVTKKQGDYFSVLDSLKTSKHPKVVLFLGSNIGNMEDERAKNFTLSLSKSLNTNDRILLGVDLIKSKDIVLPAYNDKTGVTKTFNLNLLNRINKELDANFSIEDFSHQPEYIEKEGIARSYIVSNKDQDVFIGALNKTFHFKKAEKIHTEISRKYNDTVLNSILENSQLKIVTKLLDSKAYFADYIIIKT
ncbi:L-histidine N(alpha)-methyltransferase [Xanthomarina sp. F2636L]|uniref:L-histidine N(alpha)-methyltransferase n=1 Tax=Xanthomarina sp. F2636L TaxID=2996018 RepID=UPI00225DDA08|nr:L-histidine N(alpha)-methyltransferase [Xanthomarina sp. F2636L]MCX7550578.1 L-histidine N(alpha)-methyltransferase [Xanthomarina sp. F2636L]